MKSAKSRLIVILLQMIFNSILPDHKSIDAYKNDLKSDGLIWKLLSGFTHWDAEYFLKIAHSGYHDERHLVFLPYFPLMTRSFAGLINLITFNYLNYQDVLLLSGVLINQIHFILTTVIIYLLTIQLFSDRKFASRCCHYFSYSPASIFFSTFYSESIFCFLTFSSLLASLNGHIYLSSILIGLSTITRSNGLISIGFILYFQAKKIANRFYKRKFNCKFALKEVMKTLICLVICLIPFCLYQFYAAETFCQKSRLNWCNNLFRFSYWQIQNKYWQVSFMSYYEFKQIPNFILASPIIIFILRNSLNYFTKNKSLVSSLGFFVPNKLHESSSSSITSNVHCFVYVVHVTALTLFCLFFIHIQVTTRLIASSSPVLYWAAASLNPMKNNLATKLLNLWFYSYFILGTFFYCNGYPWT